MSEQLSTFDVGTGKLVPDAHIMETGQVDLSVYTAQERFDLEREMFGRVWLNIAETSEVPNSGDWIVRQVAIRSVSVILARGKDNQIRAFHNICSHRGMKLLWDKEGRGGKFVCPYHAWTYDAQGKLLNIRDEESFKHVDQETSGLTPIRCEVWEGLIFINLDNAGTQPLVEYLGPVANRLKALPFSSYPYMARIGATIDANWKLGIEAQCEAYHVGALHSRTVSKMLVSTENPYLHPLHIEILGAHRLNATSLNPEYTLNPEKLVQAFSIAAIGHMTVKTARTDEVTESFAGHPDVNVTKSNIWGNDQYGIYPHFIFHLSVGGWWLHRFWPVAPGKTYWEAAYHFAPPSSLRAVFATQYSLALNRDTLMEDNLALVQQQEVMESGAKKIVQFGSNELVCKHLAAVSEAVSNDLAALPLAAE